jgi:pentatricopeptide repeat protein
MQRVLRARTAAAVAAQIDSILAIPRQALAPSTRCAATAAAPPPLPPPPPPEPKPPRRSDKQAQNAALKDFKVRSTAPMRRPQPARAPPPLPTPPRPRRLQRSLSGKGRPSAAAACLELYLELGGAPHRHLFHDLMALYARRRLPGEALAVLERLRAHGPPPNAHSFAFAVGALKQAWAGRGGVPPADARRAVALWDEMVAAGLPAAPAVANDALDCLAKAGLVDEAFAFYRRTAAAGVRPQPHTFSILLKACAVANQPARAAAVVREEMPAAGVRPTAATWNGLLGVFAAGEDVDRAYEVWSDMQEAGAVPDAHTARALAAAFASHPGLAAELVAEAEALAEEAGARAASAADATRRRAQAGERGAGGGGGNASVDSDRQRGAAAPSRQQHIHLDALRSGASSAAALGLTPESARGGEAGGEGGAGSRSDGGAAGAAWVDLPSLLFLDLHGHSQAAARMTLLRRLEALVEQWPAVQAAAAAEIERAERHGGGGGGRGGGQPAEGGLALCIVTGVGRHSTSAGQGVLGSVVRGALEAQGLEVRPAPGNAGRLLVPWAPLAAFLGAQREGLARARVLSAARARYLWVVAGAAGVAGAALIVPRLAPWL